MFALGSAEPEDPAHVITGTFLVNSVPAYVLFDSGASHSFVSSSRVSVLGLEFPELIDFQFVQPSGSVVSCGKLYRDVSLDFLGVFLPVDLVEFPLDIFDVILGMDWLHRHGARIDCEQKMVYLRGTWKDSIVF